MKTLEATYTVEEAERKTGISEKAMRNAMSAGRLRFVKEGQRTMIPESALNEYAAKMEKDAPSHLLEAFKARQKKSAERPNKHIDFAVAFLNLLSRDLDLPYNGPAIEFFRLHGDLKQHASPIIQAAKDDFERYVMRRDSLPKEEREHLDDLIKNSCQRVRLMAIAALQKQVKVLGQVHEAMRKAYEGEK